MKKTIFKNTAFLVIFLFFNIFFLAAQNSGEDFVLKMNFDKNISDSSPAGLSTRWFGTERYGRGYTSGANNQAADLSAGDNNYIVVDHNDVLDGMDQLYISIRAKKKEMNVGGDIIRKHAQYTITIGSSSVSVQFATENESLHYQINSLHQIADTLWHQYELIYDGRVLRLLVDGVTIEARKLTGPVKRDSSRDVYIGKNPWGDAFNGSIDELEIRNRVPAEQTLLLKMDFQEHEYDVSGNNLQSRWSGEERYAEGKSGQALDLSTDLDNFVVVEHNDMLDGMDELYLSVWAKKSNASAGGDIIRKHAQYRLSIGEHNAYAYVATENGNVVINNYSIHWINDTKWHHYELLYDGKMIQLLIDGIEAGLMEQTGTVKRDHTRDIYIGKNPWGDAFYGQIDELEIRNTIEVETETDLVLKDLENLTHLQVPISISGSKITQEINDRAMPLVVADDSYDIEIDLAFEIIEWVEEKVMKWIDPVPAVMGVRQVAKVVTIPAQAAVYGTKQVAEEVKKWVTLPVYYPCPSYSNPGRICRKDVGKWVVETVYKTVTYVVTPAKAAYDVIEYVDEVYEIAAAIPGHFIEVIELVAKPITKLFPTLCSVNYYVDVDDFQLAFVGSDEHGAKLSASAIIDLSFSIVPLSDLPSGVVFDYTTKNDSSLKVYIEGTAGIREYTETYYPHNIPSDVLAHWQINHPAAFKEIDDQLYKEIPQDQQTPVSVVEEKMAYENDDFSVTVLEAFDSRFIDNFLPDSAFSWLPVPDPKAAFLNIADPTNWSKVRDYLNDEINKKLEEEYVDIEEQLIASIPEVTELLPLKITSRNGVDLWFSLRGYNHETLVPGNNQKMILKTFISQLTGDNNMLALTGGFSGIPYITAGNEPGYTYDCFAEFDLVTPDNSFDVMIGGKIELSKVESLLNEALAELGLGPAPLNQLYPHLEVFNNTALSEYILENADWGKDNEVKIMLDEIADVTIPVEKQGVTVNTKITALQFVKGFVIERGYLHVFMGAEGKIFGAKGETSPIDFSEIKL